MDVIYSCKVGSYLGVPILLEDGTMFGTICATDPDPFLFTNDHVQKLNLFAEIIVSLISKVEKGSSTTLSQLKHFEELFAGISDKIGNSIQVIRGFLQLEETHSPYSTIMMNEVDKIREVLRDFELTTKPPALVKKDFLIDHLLNEIYIEFEDELYIKNIEFKKSEKTCITIHADFFQLKQVIKNLVRNSIEAIGTNGKIQLNITNNLPSSLLLQVNDNGHGIPAMIADKVELPFFTTKEQSIGLGLSIVKRIIDAHKGSMMIDSHEHGTTVLVQIPLKQT